MLTCFLVGLVWICTFYVFSDDISRVPLMDDLERQKVGTCYKQRGQQAAIELGHQLVSGELKAGRVAAWAEFARAHPDGYLYCFRGGLRSQLVQQWLKEAGIDYPRVLGGYKAMRSFLIETIEQAGLNPPFLCRGGACGQCETHVVSCNGAIEHNDHFLTADEKASGQKIMICVSRLQTAGGRLILDL